MGQNILKIQGPKGVKGKDKRQIGKPSQQEKPTRVLKTIFGPAGKAESPFL